jgi:putative ABC transport system permease protein
MNFKIFAIALRNVFKNRRRSILNMLTFSVSVFVILFGLGMIKGQFNAMFEKMISLKAGHMKIYNKEFPDEKRTLPLDLNIKGPEKVIEALKGAPHFRAASARICHYGIVSNSRKKENVIIWGVDFEREKQITTAFNAVTGEIPGKNAAAALVGRKLAEVLGAGPGSTLLLYSQTVNNANNLIDVETTGSYTVGFDAMEKLDFYVPYGFAEEFFDMKGLATEIIIRLDKTENVPVAKKYIQNVLKRDYPKLTVLDWKEENPELIETAKVKSKSFSGMAMIILFLSFFIIMNTMTMSVFERTAEIGTLRAIGFNKADIMALFLWEGFILSLLGVIAGYIISAPLIYYMNVYGINLDPMAYSSYNLPMDTNIKSINVFADWVYAAVICVIAGVSGSFFPAARAAGINIVGALKKGVR